MAKYLIEGGKKLQGTIRAAANKNAVLPLMAACLLTDDECVLENVPKIGDVEVMADLLESLGAVVSGQGTRTLTIRCNKVSRGNMPEDLVSRLRASVLCIAPLLHRLGHARMRHPGGCIIGRRAVGTHFDALSTLGATVMCGPTDYEATANGFTASHIFLDEASVTATEDTLLAAVVASGVTVIEHAASEPHVATLARFLQRMGAIVSGVGSNVLRIEGVPVLGGAHFIVPPDHIEVGTWAVVAAATGGEVTIEGVVPTDLPMILHILKRMGVKLELSQDTLKIYPSKVSAIPKIQTDVWPGFPTDLMSAMVTLATQAHGTTLCHDWMYEGRMFFVDKLIAMGANIILCDPHRAVVTGPSELRGKDIDSPDLRAGMALVIAALCAEGESEISKVELIERGYEDVVKRLNGLGARISRHE